jgi:hypothetical protein
MADSKSSNEFLKEQKKLLEDIELQKQRISEINKALALADSTRTKELESQLEKERLHLQYQNEQLDAIKEQEQIEAKKLTAAKDSAKVLDDFISEQSISGQMSADMIKNYKTLTSAVKKMSSLAGENVEQIQIVSELNQKIYAIESLRGQLIEAIAEKNQEEANTAATKMASISAELQAYAATNNMTKKISDNLHTALSVQKNLTDESLKRNALTEKELDAYADLTDEATKMKSRLVSISNTISGGITGALKKPSLAIGAIVMGFGTILSKVGEINKRLGVGFDFSINRFGTAGLSMVFDEAGESMKGLVRTLGDARKVSFGMQLDTNLLAVNLGIGGEESAELLANFGHLSGYSFDTAKNTLKSLQQTAMLRGVTPSAVFKDIAQNTEFFAKYSKDGGRNIGMAAIAARQLGLSLEDVNAISDSILDFETSIEKELEASALLGKDLNFQRARELAMMGDQEGMMREVVRQLGSQHEWEKMNVYERKAAADAIGLSVGELHKMYANQENLENQQSALHENYSAIKETLTAISNSIGGEIVKGMGGLIILAGQLGTGFGALKPMLSGAWEGIKGMGRGIATAASKTWEWVSGLLKAKTVTTATESISSASQFAGGSFSKGKEVLAKRLSEGKSSVVPDITKQTQTVSKGAGGFNASNMLKGAAAILILSGALFVAAKAFQEFSSVTWESVAMGLTSIGALAIMASLLGNSTPAMIKGAIAIAILGASLIPFAYALNLMAPALESFGKGWKSVLEGVATVTTSIGDVIVSIIDSISFGIATINNSITSLLTAMLPLTNMEAAAGMFAFAGSILALSQSLFTLAGTGLLAAPAMKIISAFSDNVGGATTSESAGESGNTELLDALLNEIKGLRQDLVAGKIAVHMDGYKLTSRVSKIVESYPIT